MGTGIHLVVGKQPVLLAGILLLVVPAVDYTEIDHVQACDIINIKIDARIKSGQVQFWLRLIKVETSYFLQSYLCCVS